MDVDTQILLIESDYNFKKKELFNSKIEFSCNLWIQLNAYLNNKAQKYSLIINKFSFVI